MKHPREDPLFPRADAGLAERMGYDDPVDAFRMPLMEHLRELRVRLMWSIGATLVGVVACFAFVDYIWTFLVAPMNDALVATGRGTMAITEPLEGFLTYMKIAGLAGLTLASPVIFYHAWRFVAPGLYDKEKRWVIPLMISSTALFLGGMAFGYLVIFRYAFPYFLEVTADDVTAVLSIGSYLGLVTRLLVAFGACFQLPVIAFFLARIGLIDHLDLIHFFKYGLVGIFVVAAILTPPDVLSQTLMAGPLTLLYGVSIIIARLFSTKVRIEDAAE